MSLFKQLFIATCALLLINFAGSFIVSVENSREQQVSQLSAHAQDAATALGVSLRNHLDDPAMVELMVSSIFDSGYFDSIRVIRQSDQQIITERNGAPVESIAPQWFADLVRLEPAVGHAFVSDGWQQAARIEVVSHPLFALGKLWHSMLGSLLWLALTTLLCVVLLNWYLKRQLRPLNDMVEQANAIARREFLSLPALPKTPEFRRVIKAMNQMVEKLKALFAEEATRSEQLRDQAYNDALTGIANRRHFLMQLHERLNTQELLASGYLLLIKLTDLATLNQALGGRQTDALLVKIAHTLKQTGFSVARTRSGEFSVLGIGLQELQAQQLAEQLLSELNFERTQNIQPTLTVAICAFAPGMAIEQLYAQADQALSQIKSGSRQRIALASSTQSLEQTEYWQHLLDNALQQQGFEVYAQPVLYTAPGTPIWHHKIIARLTDDQGRLLQASEFIPWLERFGWLAALDLCMLEKSFAHIRKHAQALALSVSKAVLTEASSRLAFEQLLERNKAYAHLLTLELADDQLPSARHLQTLAHYLHGLGYGLALQHFGGRFSMLGNLAGLGLSYLKIEASYIRHIDQDVDKQNFIKAMQRAASSIDMPLIAECVETENEWRYLREMGIAGAQGRLLGAPQRLRMDD